jgi:8-oxo-dGTP pyrophosphatase MutT (NUDIX family)
MLSDGNGGGGGESARDVQGPVSEGGLIPAATVIPLRQSLGGMEVLLLKRNSRGQFGNMWVFPGGRVDPSDGAAVVGNGADAEMRAARVAAAREAAEEASLDLDPSALVPFSFWVPPLGATKRFSTWFFLTEVSRSGEAVVVDQMEIRQSEWLAPATAIARVNAAQMDMAPPTFATLWWLRDQANAREAVAAARSRDPERFATHIRTHGSVLMALWQGDIAYEGGNVNHAGPRRRLVMEPGSWRIEMQTPDEPLVPDVGAPW